MAPTAHVDMCIVHIYFSVLVASSVYSREHCVLRVTSHLLLHMRLTLDLSKKSELNIKTWLVNEASVIVGLTPLNVHVKHAALWNVGHTDSTLMNVRVGQPCVCDEVCVMGQPPRHTSQPSGDRHSCFKTLPPLCQVSTSSAMFHQ